MYYVRNVAAEDKEFTTFSMVSKLNCSSHFPNIINYWNVIISTLTLNINGVVYSQ